MKVLFIYDTDTPSKLTMKVSETFLNVLKKKDMDAEFLYMKDVDTVAIKQYDILIVGAPTMILRTSSGIMQFLSNFEEKELEGKLPVVFDTKLPEKMSGNATEKLESKLEKLGLEIVSDPIATQVADKYAWSLGVMQLRREDLEKKEHWARARTLAFILFLWFSFPWIVTWRTGRSIKSTKRSTYFRGASWSILVYLWLFVGNFVLSSAIPSVGRRTSARALDATLKLCTRNNMLFFFVPVWSVGMALL